MRTLLVGLVVAVVFAGSTNVFAEIIDDIEFPHGEFSFADRVVSYSPGPQTGSPNDDPLKALGIPDHPPATGDDVGYVSLGWAGTLIVEFVDNALVDQDDAEGGLDLFIFERGGKVEGFTVAISKDGVDYIELGTLIGQPTGVDIGPFVNPGDRFRFVKLIDLDQRLTSFTWGGADIDAVGAIGSVVPEPSSLSLLCSLLAVLGIYWRRRR